MELFVLIMLYYLSQNPDFERSVKPLLGELKNSEQALKFLEELSQFSKLFSSFQNKKGGGRDGFKGENSASSATPKEAPKGKDESSPTSGIADGFIEELLQKYFHPNS